MLERANQFLETSFLAGPVFASPEGFNTQLGQWLSKANARLVRRAGARPTDLLAADKAAMMALPPVSPVTGFTSRVRPPRNYYVRIRSNDCSVQPQAISRFVDVTADLESDTISLDGRFVGAHPGKSQPGKPPALGSGPGPSGSWPGNHSRTSIRSPARPRTRHHRASGRRAFLTEASNIVLLRPPGSGKTHLATGLRLRATQLGHRVLFATAIDWAA